MGRGAVIGIGNVLNRDDGIGVMLINYIQANYEFENSVSLVDGGTCGSALANDLAGADWAIILDAVEVKGRPGEVRVYSEEEFINSSSAVKMTPHQINFLDLIQQLRLEGTSPQRVSLIGIIPATTATGTVISSQVSKSLPRAVANLLRLLDKEGVEYIKRSSPQKPDYWWIR
jgi:hydrogenase maturation protease